MFQCTDHPEGSYKTRLCRNDPEGHGTCRYGKRCRFAHGFRELKPRTPLRRFMIQAESKMEAEETRGETEKTIEHGIEEKKMEEEIEEDVLGEDLMVAINETIREMNAQCH
jgi:hypothetical protein